MTEKMTVHQALCDVKLASNKIHSALNKLDAVRANRASAKRVNGIRQEDFDKNANETFQSICDIIRRSEAIKAAISKYNASHVITVAGKQYTVAEAIYMMQHGNEAKERLINQLQHQLHSAEIEIAQANGEKLDTAAERNAQIQFGGEKSQKSADDYREFIKQYKEENQLILVDPLNVRDQIKNLQEEIDNFSAAVDAAIQTANATTEIEITYGKN